jgi:phage-related protein
MLYNAGMKKIVWVGSSLDDLKIFSGTAKREAGYWLHVVQEGREPFDTKPMPGIGAGVKEIRIHEQNEYRVIYIAKFKGAVYVLHCFVKKTRKTSKRDLELAKNRYKQAMRSEVE